MERGLLLQYVVIALAVLASGCVVVKKQFPGVVRKLRGSLALWLLKPQRSPHLQTLGRKIAPPAAGGDGACGGCNGCGPDTPKQH